MTLLTSPAAQPRWALAIHGGVGAPAKNSMTPERETAYRQSLAEALRAGENILKTNGTSLDAVVAAIKILEDSPLFNAGKGAALNRDGVAELDASIMDGATLKAGAVAAAKKIKNPIVAARTVMEQTTHILLVGPAADAFAQRHGLKIMPSEYFITEARRKQLEEIQNREKLAKPRSATEENISERVGTVGAVALDKHGNLAAGTSTGGLANKLPGRVGDSPLIGAGTYANNATCAVSGTGQGEFFIRSAAAHDVSAQIEYKKVPLPYAAGAVLKKLTDLKAEAGLIALDRKGNIATPFNTPAMFRASVRENQGPAIAIFEE